MDDATIRTFGAFELDLITGELRREGRAVPLQRQPARVLAALVARAGGLVLREDLRQAVWEDGTHVDFDRGLNYCVRHVRAVLGDDARRPRFIETVARQGYRFVAPVTSSRRARSTPTRRRLIAGAAALAAVGGLALVVAVGKGERNQSHHEAAVAVARAVHDFIF